MAQVHRDSDSRSCGASTTVVGQTTVFANGLLIAVQGDPNSHGGGSLDASVNPGTVFIEGKELVVVGSSASPDGLCPDPGGAHCSPSASGGSSDVFAF